MYGFLSNPDCSSINLLQRSVNSEVYSNTPMFPAHLSSSKYVDDGGFSDHGGGGYDCFISLGRGFSDLMAEDGSRTQTSFDNEEAVSSVKEDGNVREDRMNPEEDDDGDHSRWLQLSLGGGHRMQTTTRHNDHRLEMIPSVDLDLLPGGGGGSSSRRINHSPSPPLAPPPQLFFQVPEFRGNHPTSAAFFLQPHQTTTAAMNSVQFMTLQQQQQQQQHQETSINYNYLQLIRPFPANMMTTSVNYNPSVSSSSSFSGSSEQHGRSLHVHRRLNVARVINPPRRLHSGVWFMLQASQNQAKEPFLPQVPKSYLRIKDGRMTVGLLIKYLVNKFELASESEIEITCKGRQLSSPSTLQDVRDTIWNSPRTEAGYTMVPRSSATSNHFMVLNYGRIE